MLLITGSAGLVGRYLGARLSAEGQTVRHFDLKRSQSEDVRHEDAVASALAGVTGIVHLAAVSRVIDGERNPENCRRTNIDGLKNVIGAALKAERKPWLIFVSSREVYGDAAMAPTKEDASYSALNTYARTKVEGERLVMSARDAGLAANLCRLSTVYGCVEDHADRVLPAFCRAAATGGHISVHGNDVVLDPTHISDVARGLACLVEQTAAGERLPPIHFVSGRGLAILELARLAVAAGESATRIAIDAPRTYDVKKFVGDPSRAKALLGWQAEVPIEEGVRGFVSDFRELAGSQAANATQKRAAAI